MSYHCCGSGNENFAFGDGSRLSGPFISDLNLGNIIKCQSIRELKASLNQCKEKYSYAKIHFTSALTVHFFKKNHLLTDKAVNREDKRSRR
jgi:hypothetical protein